MKINIALAATYTADPIIDTLGHFMDKLNIECEIKFAPYNQVLQQLLHPQSLFALNNGGVNVILIRFDDWYRYTSKTVGLKIKEELILNNSKEYIAAIKKAAENSAIPYFVCLCPPNPKSVPELNEVISQVEKDFEMRLAGISNLHIIRHDEINRLYPVKDYYDEYSDKMGHIPYTEAFFTSMAAMLARKIYAQVYTPYKVIVVDCDNTLWKGVCGENDLEDIEISSHYSGFQAFLEKKRSEGMLLCICSKNNAEDVYKVFDRHPGMILRKESVVSWQCNWENKSKNIKELSKKLGLALDSMIFIDDNPLECAEVRANCPEVLTLQFPDEDYGLQKFLDHVWPFDQRKITKEDQERTLFYKQNAQREQLQSQSSSYSEFLKSLNLEVQFERASPDNFSRISQLTLRTNQFNFTTIRRKESEIEKLCSAGEYECYAVSAKDRFGDYGMIGVLIFRIDSKEAVIDTFCLSCRALGRNIEHKMMGYVCECALERGAEKVIIPFIESGKNKPAFDFLVSIAGGKQLQDGHYTFVLPAREGIALKEMVCESNNREEKNTEVRLTNQAKITEALAYITYELNDVNKILKEVNSQNKKRAIENNSHVPPRTPMEKKLAEIWSEYLNLTDIGIHDEFFAIGGSSILLLRILSKVRQLYNVEISLETIFERDFTIASLSKEIAYQKLKKLDVSLIGEKLESMKSMLGEQAI